MLRRRDLGRVPTADRPPAVGAGCAAIGQKWEAALSVPGCAPPLTPHCGPHRDQNPTPPREESEGKRIGSKGSIGGGASDSSVRFRGMSRLLEDRRQDRMKEINSKVSESARRREELMKEEKKSGHFFV